MANIFVFGSNTEGRHGRGAALEARLHHGAIYGQAEGRQGNSYAIITKDLAKGKRSIPLTAIAIQVAKLKDYAAKHTEDTFQVCAIGCRLAGYTPEEIGPMFKDSPPNVFLPKEFLSVIYRDPMMGLGYSDEQREKM